MKRPQLFAIESPSRSLWAIFLLALAVAYCVAYGTAPALPGRSGPGWFAWFDQAQYLRSAKALAAGDFSPAAHFYPPLYPLFGAVFVRYLPSHPFFIVDSASFLVTACAFVAAGSRFIGWTVAAAVFVLTVVADHAIFNQFVYPWTSTPVAAIFSLLVFILARKPSRCSRPVSFAFGLLYGLLLPLRPIDAAVFAPLLLAYCWRQLRGANRGPGEAVPHLALLVLALLPGVTLFFGFNLLVFHGWSGGYLHTSVYAFGFAYDRMLEKAVSILVDSGSIYLVPGAALLAHYPWLLLSAGGAALALLQGPLVLRSVVTCVLAAAILYLPYNDFLPIGLWRDSNIHYFTWMFPWLGFFGMWPFFVMLQIWQSNPATARRSAFLYAGALTVAIVASLVRFNLHPQSAAMRMVGTNAAAIDAAPETDARAGADVIDLIGLRADQNALYHGAHRLAEGGVVYRSYRDFRILPAAWGARVVFLRKLPAGPLRLQLDPRAPIRHPADHAIAWRIGYAIGFPCWITACGGEQK